MLSFLIMEFGYADYYIIGELVACWGSFLICINIFLSFSLFDRRQRYFLYAAAATLFAALFNIASVYLIANYHSVPITVNKLITTLYFIVLLINPFVMSIYVFDIAFSDAKKRIVFASIGGVVQAFYILIILLNLKTGWVFSFDDTGYVRGPLKNITYILSSLYGFSIIITIFVQRKFMARRIFFVFLIYPFISLFFVFIQFFFPKIILTGVASFTSVLFAYITVQSYMIEVDYRTGLMRESKLRRRISMQRKGGALFVMTIEKINIIQSSLDVKEFEQLFLQLGKILISYFPRDAYILSINRLAAVGKSLEEVKQKSKKLFADINNLSSQFFFTIPIRLDCCSAALQFTRGENDLDPMMDLINNMLTRAVSNNSRSLQICDESVLLDMERKKQIYNILKRELTLNSDMFQVWFQPIYSIKEKKFVYMEALARLNNTELGDISPTEFVPIAENRGLVERLGFVAFEKICKFIAENRDVVDAVSVNFSVHQMMNPNIVENVLNTIDRFELSPSNIVMEITESIFIDNFDSVMQSMLTLTRAGVKFYLDDFGTGYSNLANVVTLPFSTIKLDRSLVLMMQDSDKGMGLFTDLVNTFKTGGFKILVEGVENETQNALVQNAGVDYIQGYVYSHPLPPNKCLALLRGEAV